MSLQYSGSTIINRTGVMVNRVDLVNFVTQALFDAGWSTISGTPGSAGTTTVVQETPAGNQGQKVRVVSLDPNTGNCAQFFIRHSSGSPTSQTFFGLPGSSTWRVVATKFHFFAFVSGAVSKAVARTNVMGGILYAPGFLPFTAGDALAFGGGGGQSDTDAATHSNWRVTLRPWDGSAVGGRFTGIVVSTLNDFVSMSTNLGDPSIAVWQGGYNTASTSSYRWNDGTLPAYEPLVLWSTVGNAGEGKIQGQLYDAMIMNEAFTSEASITYDGHTWMALTDQPGTQSLAARATLFLAVT